MYLCFQKVSIHTRWRCAFDRVTSFSIQVSAWDWMGYFIDWASWRPGNWQSRVNNEETGSRVHRPRVSDCARFKSCLGWINRWLAVGHSSALVSSHSAFGKEVETLASPNPRSNSYPDNRTTELIQKGLSFVQLVGPPRFFLETRI